MANRGVQVLFLFGRACLKIPRGAVFAEKVAWRGAMALGLALFTAISFAQPVGKDAVRKFSVSPEYYPPPHEAQMKSLLQGAEAQPQPGGKVLITQAKLQTFQETGQREMVVEAPQCLYDMNGRFVDSAGPLQVRTGDGKISIAGEGFLWLQTNSSLVISNRVHTIVHRGLLEAPSAAMPTNVPAREGEDIDVYSDQFNYAASTGLGIYTGNVRVAGTNLSLTSGKLTLAIPESQRQLQSITAEQSVVGDYEGIHATGERAVYSTDTGFIQVTGHPTWFTDRREGSGDEIVIDRTNRILRARGDAYLKIPGQGLETSGFVPGSGLATKSPPATNQSVEIRSDYYELRTNWAIFRRDVQVSDLADAQLKGTMICREMTVGFSGTNELQRMVAEGDVVMEQEGQWFTSGRAVYTATNGLLELNDYPAWQSGLRGGNGEWIVVDTRAGEMLVYGKAFMLLPASEFAETSTMAPGAAGTTKAKQGVQFAELFSKEYILKQDNALFTGGVRIDHPQMKWVCERMTAQLASAGPQSRRIVAEQSVAFDLVDEKGQKLHGIGNKAVYTYGVTGAATNELLVLTGNPMLETTNGTLRNSVIILDRLNNKLLAPGKYEVLGPADTGVTNLFRLPNKKLTR